MNAYSRYYARSYYGQPTIGVDARTDAQKATDRNLLLQNIANAIQNSRVWDAAAKNAEGALRQAVAGSVQDPNLAAQIPQLLKMSQDIRAQANALKAQADPVTLQDLPSPEAIATLQAALKDATDRNLPPAEIAVRSAALDDALSAQRAGAVHNTVIEHLVADPPPGGVLPPIPGAPGAPPAPPPLPGAPGAPTKNEATGKPASSVKKETAPSLASELFTLGLLTAPAWGTILYFRLR
jgi:hypothetical protein